MSVQDCFDGYLWLLDRGFTPEQIVIAGDSAGGFLTAMTAVTIRDWGMPHPAGLICENLLIDPTPSRRREGAYRIADPLFPHRAFTEFDRLIRKSEPAGDAVAPLDGDLSGLLLTPNQVGSHETLRVDSEDFAAALAAAGVPVRLEIYKGAVHVFQAFIDVLPESRTAIKAMARFAVQAPRRRRLDRRLQPRGRSRLRAAPPASSCLLQPPLRAPTLSREGVRSEMAREGVRSDRRR